MTLRDLKLNHSQSHNALEKTILRNGRSHHMETPSSVTNRLSLYYLAALNHCLPCSVLIQSVALGMSSNRRGFEPAEAIPWNDPRQVVYSRLAPSHTRGTWDLVVVIEHLYSASSKLEKSPLGAHAHTWSQLRNSRRQLPVGIISRVGMCRALGFIKCRCPQQSLPYKSPLGNLFQNRFSPRRSVLE